MKTVLCGFCADDFLVNSMKITEYEVRSNLVSLKQDKQDKKDKKDKKDSWADAAQLL